MKKEQYHLEKHIERLQRELPTNFVEGSNITVMESLCKKRNVNYQVFRLFEDCEKVIFYNLELPNIACFKLESSEAITHQEVLGSLFSHQIDPDTFGDIIMKENTAYIVVVDHIKKYIEQSLQKIGNKKVNLKEIPYLDLKDYKYSYIEKEIIIPSNRLDNVLSKLCKMSRKQIHEKLQNDEIRINYEIANKASYEVKVNDIISIRRVGKFKYINCVNQTKKGNSVFLFLQYK